ncbi:MAG: hypothetical protein ACI4QT_04445 [Kiritimatiellia bacterium]
MGYLPKKTVESGVKKRVRKDKLGRERVSYEAYLGTDPFTKNPIRITRADERELEKVIKDFYQRYQAGGDAAVRLSAIQSLDARNALDELAAAGEHISLTEAVRAYLGGAMRVSGADSAATIGETWEEFYNSKKSGDDKRQHRYSTGKFVQAYGTDRPLALVTAKEVVDYLETNYGNRTPKTYNANLLSLKTFFNWCAKDERRYIPASPIKSIKFKPEPWKEPEYMKPADVERLFRLLESLKGEHPEYLAQAIVGFFCGTRAVEIRRMAMIEGAAKIHLDDEMIRIAMGKGFQRGKMPRAFHIEPTAMAWMRSFDFLAALKRVGENTVAEIYALARKHDIPVFQNCVRHTFITYHVAAFGDPAKTQAIVGTSARYRAMNYCGLANKADALAYFNILPTESVEIAQ